MIIYLKLEHIENTSVTDLAEIQQALRSSGYTVTVANFPETENLLGIKVEKES